MTDEFFHPSSKNDWRNWLEKHHIEKDAIWIIINKKNHSTPNLSWSDAVDEALCFGWIDGKKLSNDDTSYKQYFCKRKASSTWSKVNKEKIKNLSAQNLIHPAGLAAISIAKENGMWTFLDEIDELIIPKDLEAALSINKKAQTFFEQLSPSQKKQLLYWIKSAKQEKTRKKRISDIISSGNQDSLPTKF